MPYNVLDQTTAAAAPATTLGAPLVSTGETLASLLTELLLQLGNRDDTTIGSGRPTAWINKAYRNVAAMLTIKELDGSLGLNFVANQPFYLVPVQVAWIKRLGVSDPTNYKIWQGRELDPTDLTTYRNYQPLVAPPRSYFRYRRMVVVWPTPDAAYTAPLDFRVRPDDLVNLTDSPLLPIEFHNAILLQSRVVALRALLNWADAMKAQNDFVSEIKPLINTDAAEAAAPYAVVGAVRHTRSLFRRSHE